MNKYKEGKIYKIICNITGDIYIGSTVDTLHRRLIKHKSSAKTRSTYISSREIIDRGDYQIELVEHYPCDSKFELRQREGYWQKTVECVNKQIECRTNKQWRKDNIEKVRKNNKLYCKKNEDKIVEYQKVYRAQNKEHIAQQIKEYRDTHKEHIFLRDKKYRAKNKEKLKIRQKKQHIKHKDKRLKYAKEYREQQHVRERNAEYHKKYRKEKQEELKVKSHANYLKHKHITQVTINCDCGGTYTSSAKNRHERTKLHIKYIETGIKVVDTRPRYICVCGGNVIDKPENKIAHEKTKLHVEFINKQ